MTRRKRSRSSMPGRAYAAASRRPRSATAGSDVAESAQRRAAAILSRRRAEGVVPRPAEEFERDVEDLGPFVRHARLAHATSRICRRSWPALARRRATRCSTARFFAERAEIFDLVRDRRHHRLRVVAGDKHSFWAGMLSKSLPPRAVRAGRRRVHHRLDLRARAVRSGRVHHRRRIDPLRPLYLHDRPDGSVAPAINMTVLHGVRSCARRSQKTGDATQARAQSNPDVAPHLSFADLGGHGYATVRASADAARDRVRLHPAAARAQRTARRRPARLSRRAPRQAVGRRRAAATEPGNRRRHAAAGDEMN